MRSAILAAAIVTAWGAALDGARAQPAADAECVWQATTAPMREAMRASLRAHHGIVDGLSEAQARGLMRTCRLPDTDRSADLVIITLRGRILVLEAEEGLKASLALTPERLAEGWRRLTPADRRALSRGFEPIFSLPQGVQDAMAAWAMSLELRADADRALLFDYAVGRAMLDGLEPR